MNIRFVSTLTPEDEDLLAPALLNAVAALLDPLELAYSLRIETTGTQILQHLRPAVDKTLAGPVAPASPINQ